MSEKFPNKIWLFKNDDRSTVKYGVIEDKIKDSPDTPEYILKSTVDREKKEIIEWHGATMDASDDLQKERLEEILKPIREAIKEYGDLSKDVGLLRSLELIKAIKETLERADQL